MAVPANLSPALALTFLANNPKLFHPISAQTQATFIQARFAPRLTDLLPIQFLPIRQIPNPCSPKYFTGRFLHNPFPHCSLNTT
jgi:hypothetical protein